MYICLWDKPSNECEDHTRMLCLHVSGLETRNTHKRIHTAVSTRKLHVTILVTVGACWACHIHKNKMHVYTKRKKGVVAFAIITTALPCFVSPSQPAIATCDRILPSSKCDCGLVCPHHEEEGRSATHDTGCVRNFRRLGKSTWRAESTVFLRRCRSKQL